MMDVLEAVFSVTFLAMVIRQMTPLLLATLGGLISDLSGALNVALEGMMLISALTAVLVSVHYPWYVAVLAAMTAGSALGLLMAFFHLRMRADIILVGFAVNIVATGGTVFALSLATGGDKGTSINLVSKAVPAVNLPFLKGVPGIGDLLFRLLSGHSLLTWFAFVAVFGLWFFLYRMRGGLWLRAVGEYPAAPAAAGIKVDVVRMWALVASGAFTGLAGAQLAMFNYVGFTRDMTAGRGFIALGAVLLGARHPIGALLAALLFGVFDALSFVIATRAQNFPAELIQAIPFVVTIIALILFSWRAQRAKALRGA
ncbi:simple sugar transport system permease protein [Ketogulonicigenium robustum]|uniref:Simple sugar transport system permease protein n=1 Tax=Ketogulonicigenium robustum TaxID=92947 RepID=A0A1W6NYF1_9RHOB|nr:ABC transporter permease [Ketogulonicigenium robustum]ARO14183.1 simple sugar transport system permease protein [Ketogulonicigenium robustum]